jgi:hypothetical protein
LVNVPLIAEVMLLNGPEGVEKLEKPEEPVPDDETPVANEELKLDFDVTVPLVLPEDEAVPVGLLKELKDTVEVLRGAFVEELLLNGPLLEESVLNGPLLDEPVLTGFLLEELVEALTDPPPPEGPRYGGR